MTLFAKQTKAESKNDGVLKGGRSRFLPGCGLSRGLDLVCSPVWPREAPGVGCRHREERGSEGLPSSVRALLTRPRILRITFTNDPADINKLLRITSSRALCGHTRLSHQRSVWALVSADWLSTPALSGQSSGLGPACGSWEGEGLRWVVRKMTTFFFIFR